MTITFGKMIAYDESASEAEIFGPDGDCIGSIIRESYDAGATSIEYRTSSYTVELDSDEGQGKIFQVAHPVRWGKDAEGFETARKALAAAKAYAREELN